MRIVAMFTAALLGASALEAQTSRPTVDSRLLPFVGCWTTTTEAMLTALPTASRTLCVVPGETATSLRMLSVRGDSIVATQMLDVGGRRVPISRESCTGYATSAFAESGSRVFVEEMLECSGGTSARSTEVLDLANVVEFIQVRAWRRRDVGDARFVRWTALEDTASTLPAEVKSALSGRWQAVATAREMASTDVTFTGVVEASSQLDEPVLRTWVFARGAGNRVKVTGDQLRSLKKQGVPGSVTDVLVALSHPEVFQFANQGMIARVPAQSNDRSGYMPGRYGWGPGFASAFGNGCFTGWGLCAWDPFMWNGFGNPWFGFNRFGWGGGWGGWGGWGGGLPVGWVPGSGTGGGVVPVYTGPRESGGYVDRSRGYTSGGSGGGNPGAEPRGGMPSASGGGGGGGGGGVSAPSSGDGGGGGGRVAVPRPPY